MRRVVLGLVLVAGTVIAVVGWWLAGGLEPSGARPLTASGTIEADEAALSSEVTGLVTALPVSEGDRVAERQVVARIGVLMISVGDSVSERQVVAQLSEGYAVRAPRAGVVTSVAVKVGEVARPGQPLVTVSDLNHLKLTVYVLERDLGLVGIGQAVSIKSDSFSDRTFLGAVTSINSGAEFTPRNMQTQRDRLNLVFGVKVRVDDPEGSLRPGMPVDATFAVPVSPSRTP